MGTWFNNLDFMRKRRGMLTKKQVRKNGENAFNKLRQNRFDYSVLSVGDLIALSGRNKY